MSFDLIMYCSTLIRDKELFIPIVIPPIEALVYANIPTIYSEFLVYITCGRLNGTVVIMCVYVEYNTLQIQDCVCVK